MPTHELPSSETVQGDASSYIRRRVEAVTGAQPPNEEEEDDEMEREILDERRSRNLHLRGLAREPLPNRRQEAIGQLRRADRGWRSPNIGFGTARVPNNQANRRTRTSSNEAGNRYQIIRNREDPVERSDTEHNDLAPYHLPLAPAPGFDSEDRTEDGSQRTFVRRVIQPQGNGVAWLLAEIRQAEDRHRRQSRLSTMTSASTLEAEVGSSAHGEISRALQRSQPQPANPLPDIQRSERQPLSLEPSISEEVQEPNEDGGQSDTTVTQGSGVLLTDSVLDAQVRFMLQLQQLQEQIDRQQHEEEEPEQFQLPTPEERTRFERLSQNYENFFRDYNTPDAHPTVLYEEPAIIGSPQPEPSRPYADHISFERILSSASYSRANSHKRVKMVMARSSKTQVMCKAVSWIRSGVTFQGKVIVSPSRTSNLRDSQRAISNVELEAGVELVVHQVNTDQNQVSCTLIHLPIDGETSATEELWEGEMLEGPFQQQENELEQEAVLHNVTKYWQQLFLHHTLNGTSKLFSRPLRVDYASSGDMHSKARQDYVWLLLRAVRSRGISLTPRQILLSVRRSDGALEGVVGYSSSEMKLLFMTPAPTSMRGGLSDISFR